MPAPLGKQALTAVFPVLSASSGSIVASIEAVAAALAAKLAAAESVHSARFVLLDGRGARGKGEGTLLLFATIFDGSAETHLDELWRLAGGELERVLGACKGWASPGTRESFGRFVSGRARPASALFSAHAALSVPQIRADGALRRELSRWLSEHDAELRPLAPIEIVRQAREHFGAGGDSARGVAETHAPYGAVQRVPASKLTFVEWLALGVTFARSCVHDVFDLFGGLWHDTLTSPESAAVVATSATGSRRMFSHAAEVKVGSFRRAALRSVLRVLGRLSQRASVVGKVPGVEAVHSARFMLLEDGRLIFLADFDASVESTLERAAERLRGLVGMIWSHTRGFPLSFGWYAGGARDTAKLRDFAREGELVTPFRYSGYPELGVRQVRENAEIRRILSDALDAVRARRLLSLVRD